MEQASQPCPQERVRTETHASGRTVPRLCFPEQIVLWSARRFAAASAAATASEEEAAARRQDILLRIGMEFDAILRPRAGAETVDRAGRTAEALAHTLESFGSLGVRPLRLNPPSCRFVGSDERLLLAFIAGCQAGDHGHTASFLSWFFPPCQARVPATHGAALAAAFADARLILPQRLRLDGCACAGGPTDRQPRLH